MFNEYVCDRWFDKFGYAITRDNVDEVIEKLGYRFDSGAGELYKYDEEENAYIFCYSTREEDVYEEIVSYLI